MKVKNATFSVGPLIIGLVACMTASLCLAGPIDCGNKPISLAFFDFGFLYYEKDGRGRGIDKDISDEIAKRSACRFATQSMPRARVWADLESGDLDMSVSGIQTPERDRFAWFVPYTSIKNVVLLRTASTTNIARPQDFLSRNQLRFGVVRGFTHEAPLNRFIAQLRPAQRIEESASVSLLFEKLKLGRVDGVFSQSVVYRKILQELDMESEVTIRDWIPKEKGAIGNLILARSRFSAEDAQRWRKLVGEMRADGTLEQIYARYVSADEARKFLAF